MEFWEDGLSAGEEAAGAAARLLEARSALAQEQERESEYRLAAWPLGFSRGGSMGSGAGLVVRWACPRGCREYPSLVRGRRGRLRDDAV